MQAVIVGSIYGYRNPPVFNCPSDCCTWLQTATLGFCASCSNVTSASAKNCSYIGAAFSRCNYTTPTGQLLNVVIQASGMQKSYTRLASTARQSEWDPATDQPVGDATLLKFASAVYPDARVVGELKDPDITECTIDWCAKVYGNATAFNGSFSFQKEDDYLLTPARGWRGDFEGSQHGTTPYAILTGAGDFPQSLNGTFTINKLSANELAEFLASVLNAGRLTQYIGSSPDYEAFSMGAGMLNNPSISSMAETIAASMTGAARGIPGTQSLGGAWKTVTYTKVNWQWLTLPTALIALGAALLGCTVYHNHEAQAVLWKSSSLALLFHPLQGWDDHELRATTPEAMGRAADGMRGQLKDYENSGLRIVRI